jgi:hypothetical protein
LSNWNLRNYITEMGETGVGMGPWAFCERPCHPE